MPTAYKPVTITVVGLPGWVLGVTRYYGYDKTLTCAQAQAQFVDLSPEQKVAQTTASVPNAPAGFHWVARSCGDTGDTYVTAEPGDFAPLDTGGGGGDSTPVVGATAIVSTNPDVLALAVEWNSDQSAARLKHTNKAQLSAGQNHYYFLDGQPYVSDLPTSYDLKPGDDLSLYYAASSSPSVQDAGFNTKGTAAIYIGNPPA